MVLITSFHINRPFNRLLRRQLHHTIGPIGGQLKYIIRMSLNVFKHHLEAHISIYNASPPQKKRCQYRPIIPSVYANFCTWLKSCLRFIHNSDVKRLRIFSNNSKIKDANKNDPKNFIRKL